MERLFSELLKYFKITEEQYKFLTRDLSFDDIPSPYQFQGMEKAIVLCNEAIINNQKIMIYGDYDCDGIMSTSIVYLALKQKGNNPGYYIPSRYIDGYGLTIERAKQIIDRGYKLLITVDNGISTIDSIKYCKDHGLQVIIIDHHQAGDVLPNADAIIHPQISNFSKMPTSAGFCSFMFSYALLDRVDDYLLVLGAISVISDMMPLLSFNRDIVRLATNIYKTGKYLPLDLLKEGDNFDYLSIGMRMSPKINAVGRVLKTKLINNLVEFLVSFDNPTRTKEIYKLIEQCNENRKELSRDADITISDEEINQSGIVKLMDIEEGLLGIVANRMINQYRKPVVVLTYDLNDPTVLKGSCRAGEGFNIVKCFEELTDLLINGGGHAFAGGLTIKKENLNKFKEKFIACCEKHPIIETKEETIEINIQDVNSDSYKLINSFSPFGEEWKAPLFCIHGIKTSSLTFSKTGEHILTTIGQNTKLVGFNMNRKDVCQYDFVDLIGNMNFYVYRGYGNIQFLTKKYQKSNKY